MGKAKKNDMIKKKHGHGTNSDYASSNFLKGKSEMKNVIMGLIKYLKIECGIQVKHARCSRAGENKDFE